MPARRAAACRMFLRKLMRGLDADGSMARSLVEAERREESQPQPKPWGELSPDAQQALRDFGTFCEMFLLRRPVAWRQDAAERVVEALQDRSKRSYIVANEPPGSGKSTLFTHDIPVWLICGGGLCDPLRGRATRIMVGSFGFRSATHYALRIRRLLESSRPYYDKATQRRAELSLVKAYGRFKPRQEGATWKADEFVVEQMDQVDLTEKEPTIQVASRESGFLGERVELSVWDDVVTTTNVRSVDVRSDLARWFEDEAETRIEPGGALLLVGQRLGPDDLYRSRLDVSYVDDDEITRRKYTQVRYPAHNEATCDGDHRQWDARADGCLLDAQRLPWTELQAQGASNPRKFRLVYAQEDVDPAGSLIHPAWIDGGVDRDGVLTPGCYDTDRGFMEWPAGVSGLIDYVTIDPSAGGYWGIQWWCVQPQSRVRYLIRGLRSSKFRAGDLLQWDTSRGDLTGLMQEWQAESVQRGHRIAAWVLEANSAFKHLTQYDHFRVWQRRWGAGVILHQTQRNKWDEQDRHRGAVTAAVSPGAQAVAAAPRRPRRARVRHEVHQGAHAVSRLGDEGSGHGRLAGRVEPGADPCGCPSLSGSAHRRGEAPCLPSVATVRDIHGAGRGARVRRSRISNERGRPNRPPSLIMPRRLAVSLASTPSGQGRSSPRRTRRYPALLRRCT